MVDLTTGSQFHVVDPVFQLGSKSRCLGVPSSRPSLPVPLVPFVTVLGFVDYCGFHIVTLSHNKTGPDFLKTRSAVFPRAGSALSACSSASSVKPSVSDYEKCSVSLSSNDSEPLSLPLVAIISSVSAASSFSEACRLSVVSWMFMFSASSNSSFTAFYVPCFSLLTSFWWQWSGRQNPGCRDSSSSRSGVSMLPGIEPTSDFLMITSWNANTLRVLKEGIRCLLKCNSQTFLRTTWVQVCCKLVKLVQPKMIFN